MDYIKQSFILLENQLKNNLDDWKKENEKQE